MIEAGASDVFLSYSRADADAVVALRARLTEAGITSFLDRTALPAGQPWQPFLENELGRSSAVVVFVGQRMGSWQYREVQVALDRQAREHDFPVIPVLLPGLDDEPKGFLALQTWIDLRAGTDDPVQLQNLIAAIHREAPEGVAAIKAAICPYRGLLPFREEDAAFFFGRDDWIKDLAAKVQAHRLVAVVGRSGSGKSSLVFAGLFPALRRSPGGTTWDMLAIRPGHEPLNALAEALSPPPEDATPAERIEKINANADRLRRGTVRLDQLVRHHLDQQPGTDRLLLYVDQWEELYTLAARRNGAGEEEKAGRADTQRVADKSRADVARFLDLLLEAAGERDSPLTVVLTVRADFYDHLLRHPTLPATIQGQQLNLGPMTRAQLRQCIEGPATAVGIGFEGNLVESILDEVGEDEGKLPLLEYALRETWEASRKSWQNAGAPGLLTFAAYNAIGRVGGAIGTRAEQIYKRLDEAQQQAARRLFVSLVTPGEGQEDTRARASFPDEPVMTEVVRKFSDPAARLLVTGWDQSRGERLAEVSHEALIRNWGTLRSWIEANREILRARERIRGQTKHWEQENEPDDLLLQRGHALEEGRQLLTSHGDVLIDDIRPYIQRSIERNLRLLEEEQRKREKEHWTQLASVQASLQAQEFTSKRTMRVLTAVGVLVIGALISIGSGWLLAENRVAKLEASNEELKRNIRDQAAAYERTVRALHAAIGAELLVLRGHEAAVVVAAFSADGTRILSGSFDRTVRVWDSANGMGLLVLRGHEQRVMAVGFSPDGTRIVSGSADGTVRVWDAANGTELLVLRGHEGAVYAAGFSLDGARIVSGSFDRSVRIWDSTNGVELLILRGHEGRINAVAFSPDGTRIVSGSADGTVRVWDAGSGAQLLVLRGHDEPVSAAGFSRDGARIMSGSADGTVRTWDATIGAELLVLRGHEGRVRDISRDGARIVSVGNDRTVRVWDGASGAELFLRGHQGAVYAAGLSPDGARIVSGSEDGTVRVWFVGKDDAALVAHACARLRRDLTPEETRRFDLDPDTPWRCGERAQTLWPHPVGAATAPAAGPPEDAGAAAAH